MSHDIRNLAGGGGLVLFGLVFAGDAALRNEIGTLRQIGPGLFPLIVGSLLVVFGLIIAVPALGRGGARINLRLREPLFALGGVASFAVLIGPFGLFPAIISTVFISARADKDYRPVSLAVMAAWLCVTAWLTFRVGLGLPLTLARWPF